MMPSSGPSRRNCVSRSRDLIQRGQGVDAVRGEVRQRSFQRGPHVFHRFKIGAWAGRWNSVSQGRCSINFFITASR
jgi:hypothetical protein